MSGFSAYGDETRMECLCAYPYVGSSCEEIDYCSGIDCLHGVCSEVVNGTGFVCTCDEGSRYIVNTETGLCTTFLCEESNDVCFNEAQCVTDIEDPLDSEARCQCRNYDAGENCDECKRIHLLHFCLKVSRVKPSNYLTKMLGFTGGV